jgi:deoxyadenosine/deoxycytidine kinase
MIKEGKIIAVVGAAAVGKSTLVRNFSDNYNVQIILEGEEKDVPKYIWDNIASGENGHQTILWFHNKTTEDYLHAQKMKQEGHNVILDTFWLSNSFYHGTMLSNKEDLGNFRKLVELNGKILPKPDYIIFISASDELIEQRLKDRGREAEKDFLSSALKINKAHKDYFKDANKLNCEVLTIDAENINYPSLANQLGLK